MSCSCIIFMNKRHFHQTLNVFFFHIKCVILRMFDNIYINLIPCPGPQAIPVALMLEDSPMIATQSSPV